MTLLVYCKISEKNRCVFIFKSTLQFNFFSLVGVKQRGSRIPLCQSSDCNSRGVDTGYRFRGTPRRRGQRH